MRLCRWSSSILAILLLATSPEARAQAGAGTPEAFALQQFDAMRAGDWDGAAKLMHPEALQQLKELFSPVVAADSLGQFAPSFFGVQDLAEFEKTSSEQLFSRMMQTMVQVSPEMGPLLAGAEMEMIGHVREERTDVVHVVYRMRMNVEGISMAKVAVTPLRAYGDEWRAMLTGDIEGLAAALSRQLK